MSAGRAERAASVFEKRRRSNSGEGARTAESDDADAPGVPSCFFCYTEITEVAQRPQRRSPPILCGLCATSVASVFPDCRAPGRRVKEYRRGVRAAYREQNWRMHVFITRPAPRPRYRFTSTFDVQRSAFAREVPRATSGVLARRVSSSEMCRLAPFAGRTRPEVAFHLEPTVAGAG